MTPTIKINLLDWRQARRDRRQQQFLVALGGVALVSAGMIVLVLTIYGNAIENQQARNNYLQQQITEIDKQIKEIKELEKVRQNLITRMRIIEELQQSRAQIVHYFDQILETLPDGVYLTAIKQNGSTTTINGVAESNGRVSSYMVNLDDSPWFDDPRLVVIKSKEEGRVRFADFTLTFKTVTPPQDQADAAAG